MEGSPETEAGEESLVLIKPVCRTSQLIHRKRVEGGGGGRTKDWDIVVEVPEVSSFGRTASPSDGTGMKRAGKP